MAGKLKSLLTVLKKVLMCHSNSDSNIFFPHNLNINILISTQLLRVNLKFKLLLRCSKKVKKIKIINIACKFSNDRNFSLS